MDKKSNRWRGFPCIFFQFKKGELYAEDVPVSKLAEEFGTPLVYL